jgi:hypothetical protein
MIKLLICSPVLAVDEYCNELVDSLLNLRVQGLEFTHIVVGPERNREDVLRVFGSLHSIFLAERAGTRGVFDAVAQGYEYGLRCLAPTHLSYINADDLLQLGFLNAVSCCRLGIPQLITGEVNWIGEKGQIFGRVPRWPWRMLASALFEAGIPAFTQQGAILSAEAWRFSRGFDPSYRYIADSVLWHKLLKDNAIVRVHVPDLVASYRMRSGQLSANRAAVTEENRRWVLSIKNTEENQGVKLVAKIAMRIVNMPIYVRRFFTGRLMKTEKAMTSGGF